MKNIKETIQKLKQNRKFRCGGFSVLLTLVAVGIAIGVVALADGLENRFALSRDFSFNAATTQGEITRAVLAGLEKDVHIYALIAEEGPNDTLLQLLQRYDAASEKVTVSEENVLRNPALLEKFAAEIGDKKVNRDCLIIHCKEQNRARVLDEDDYYLYSYDTESGMFSVGQMVYEKSVTEAVLYVTQDELPTVQVLTGHGELTKADAADMEKLLISANYDVEWVQLGQTEPDPESPLMILCPLYDFSASELEQIMDYARQGGDFILASHYSDPVDMENYNALLRAYGAKIHPGIVIAMEEDTDSYYADTPVWLMPYMQETMASLPLLEKARDLLVLPGARAFERVSLEGGNMKVYSLLETGRAYIRDFTDGKDTTARQETDKTGYFDVALWTEKMFEDGTVSKALIIGNADVFTEYWLQNNTDAPAFLLQMLHALQGKAPVNLDIVPKNAIREGLRLDNTTPAVAAVVLLPLLVLVAAVWVLLPRKSR